MSDHQPQKTKKSTYFAIGAAVLTTLVVVVDIGASSRIMPHTFVGDLKLGLLKKDDAKTQITQNINTYLNQKITFKYQDKTADLSPGQLGVTYSIDGTLNTLPYFYSQKQSPVELLVGIFSKHDLPFQYTLDQSKAVSILQKKLGLADQRAKNAQLQFQGKNLVVTTDAPGVEIVTDKLQDQLNTDFKALKTTPVIVETEIETPSVTAAELSTKKDKIFASLSKPLLLISESKALKLNLLEHLDAVDFIETKKLIFGQNQIPLIEVADDIIGGQNAPKAAKIQTDLSVRINPDKLEKYLGDNLYKDIENPVSGVKIYTDNTGKIIIDGKGEDGKVVPRDRLAQSISMAVENNIDRVVVPLVTETAPVEISQDLQDMGIKELIGTGHTSFYGSHPNRLHNIAVGIAKFNGHLIKQGELFSFTDILGPVDDTTGYLPEKVIKKDKVVDEFGGGLCQVSSTAYRAALYSGLPIKQRAPHSWLVPYYGQIMGPGMDATIYPGVQDLKFINDTPGAIVMQAYTDGFQAYFKYYGTSDGRSVAMDGPYGSHLTWKWYRYLTKADGTVVKETINSQYKPQPPPDQPGTTTPADLPQDNATTAATGSTSSTVVKTTDSSKTSASKPASTQQTAKPPVTATKPKLTAPPAKKIS